MGLFSSSKTHNTRSSTKPSLMSGRKQPATVETHQSRNPITGTTTTTTTTTQKSKGHGHGGQGPLASGRTTGPAYSGRTTGGPMASSHRTGHSSHTHRTGATTTHHRQPTAGDKMSGGLMNLKGTLTGRPGVKGAGTRRMHGTDGRGTTRRY